MRRSPRKSNPSAHSEDTGQRFALAEEAPLAGGVRKKMSGSPTVLHRHHQHPHSSHKKFSDNTATAGATEQEQEQEQKDLNLGPSAVYADRGTENETDNTLDVIDATTSSRNILKSENIIPPSASTAGREGWGPFFRAISRKKSLDELMREVAHEGHSEEEGAGGAHAMRRTLTAVDLTMMGIGGIVGTGIFVLTGTVAANNAGPAIVISFILAGAASAFAGLCYAELSSMIPVAGSAYTYAYATLGEIVAWIIGWDLILEYLIGSATVASGWSGYLQSFFVSSLGMKFKPEWSSAPVKWDSATERLVSTGAIMNLPAAFVTFVITALLVVGIQESARANSIVVVIKLAVIALFLMATFTHVNPANWTPFVPENTGTFGHFGASGILQGATIVFFAYIGFDSISTTAQECRNPQRDIPIGILLSLTICTALYIVVSLFVTGLVSYKEYAGISHPISFAVERMGEGYGWLSTLISIGALAGLTSVMLIQLMGQPRVFYAMAKDGLLPSFVAILHKKYKTPYITTILSGLICGICAALLPIDILSELTSIGTLFAFVLVSIGVMVLRIQRPEVPRAFKVPFGPYVIPLSGAFSSLLLMSTATLATLGRFFVWMGIGLIIYFSYGYRRSNLTSSTQGAKRGAMKNALSHHHGSQGVAIMTQQGAADML